MRVDRSRPAERVAEHQQTGRGVHRVGYPIRVRRAVVRRRELLTPRMLRLTLACDRASEFHSYVADDHVKLVFPLPDGTRNDPVPGTDDMLRWSRPMPPTRSYTVRRQDLATGELDLDFVLHGDGLAGGWAAAAEVGAEAVVAGPPGGKAFARRYRHYVLAVDPTALPAVARWLDEADWLADAGATAQVLIDHDHPEEAAYPLRERPEVEITWDLRDRGSRQADRVAALPLPEDTFVFGAGEAGDLKPLRSWVAEKGYDTHIAGYWKRGVAGLEE